MSAALATLLTQYLDQQQEHQTDFLRELVRAPSDNPPGNCASHGQRLQALLASLGLAVEAFSVPAEEVRANSMISATNLIVRHAFGSGGPVVALNAHGDAVPPGLGWRRDPYAARIEDDPEHGPVMYGRGVAVSKSDIAAYTWVLLALREAERQGARLRGRIELHFTYDEEARGEIGPKWLLARELTCPDYAICAGFSYAVTNAHNGCLQVEINVRGKQAHAAMPASGADALEAANRILSALYAYRDRLCTRHSASPGIDTPSLIVGTIRGGINTNVVPDLVTFRVDRRMIPEEAGEDAEGELRRIVEQAVAPCRGVSVSVRRLLLANPLAPLPGVERLCEPLARHARDIFQTDIPLQGVPLFTDARHYAARGIPTVLYGAGPRSMLEARGHNSDENLRLNDLYRASKVLALSVAELLAAPAGS
ncbi:M20/M25/M40 family metallo-hydrolase [Orrella sp. JC864]|uniref:M20/M25/M40 family metallo-hydrolase n=1 Tax=Orrella sp. JC864 TaxID=3120298 RepID=UPI00300B9CBF